MILYYISINKCYTVVVPRHTSVRYAATAITFYCKRSTASDSGEK